MTDAIGTEYRGEIGRKLIHFSSALIPLHYLFLSRAWMLLLLGGCLALMLALELLRATRPAVRAQFEYWLGFMLRPAERGALTGATWVFLAAFLAIALFRADVAIAVLLILSISDSLAALIGRRFGRQQFLGKSLAGSSAFFLSALLLTGLTLPAWPGVAFMGAAVATVIEALDLRIGPLQLNDNLAIPLVTGIVLMLLLEGRPTAWF
jgi:dolichol kinase